MAKIDIVQLRKSIRPAINSLANLALGAATEKFEAAKRELILNFEQHPVTKELKEGENAPNYSQTLDTEGNLFSFIGFNSGEDPTEVIEEALNEYITITKRPKIVYNRTTAIFTFSVHTPSLSDFEALTPYPDGWNSGGWAVDIEHSIPNLRYYLYKQNEQMKSSRSGPAIQTPHTIRGQQSFRRTKYISELLAGFIARVERLVI